jgi:hypothetical protein
MTTLGVGSGAAIAGLLGMNLKNFLEEWEYGFPLITSIAFGTSMLICGYGLLRLKRIQKLTLYGRYPAIGGRRNGNGMTAYDKESLSPFRGWNWKWTRAEYDRNRDHEYHARLKWWKRMLKRRY